MRSLTLTPALVAAVIAALALSLMLPGCGGDDDDDDGAVSGGTVVGRTIDATWYEGLGGVQVIIGRVELVNGQAQFVPVRSAYSTTPDGVFTITGIPAGSYNRLRVVPNLEIWPQQDVTPSQPIVVADGQRVDIGPILVLDDLPPSPGA